LKLGWLVGPSGVKVVGIGLATTTYSVFSSSYENIWFLLTGNIGVFALREFLFLPVFALAAIFCLFSFFLFRPGFPRIAIGAFSASMTSHVILPFASLHPQQMKAIATCRIFASLGLVFLYFHFRSEAAEM
jgi:hypothetical protein